MNPSPAAIAMKYQQLGPFNDETFARETAAAKVLPPLLQEDDLPQRRMRELAALSSRQPKAGPALPYHRTLRDLAAEGLGSLVREFERRLMVRRGSAEARRFRRAGLLVRALDVCKTGARMHTEAHCDHVVAYTGAGKRRRHTGEDSTLCLSGSE